MRKKSAPIPNTTVHPPVLIVDPGNLVGIELYQALKEEAFVVLVSPKAPPTSDQLVFLEYKNRIPKIPDSYYHYIYFIWDGRKNMLELIPEFLKKARHDRVPFVFILPYQFIEQASLPKIIPQYKNSFIFVLGDMFAKDTNEASGLSLDTFLYGAKATGGIRVEGMGLTKLYPITVSDTVFYLRKTLSEKKAPGIIYYLFPQAALTQLAVLRILQRIDPLIHIDFLPDKNRSNHPFTPTSGEHVVVDMYPLREKIAEAYNAIILRREEKLVASADKKTWMITSTIIPQAQKAQNPYLTAIGLYVLYAVLIFIFSPLVGTLGFAYLGMQNLQWAKASLEKGDLQSASNTVAFSKQSFINASFMASFLLPEATLVGQSNLVGGMYNSIDAGKTLAETAGFILESSLAYKRVFAGISQFPSRDFMNGTNALKDAITDYELLGLSNAVPPEYKDKLMRLQGPIQYISSVGPVLPQIFGVDGFRTYAILFQNNMELRPGGGFIGSYGILKLHNGKIEEFSIHDVYDADGQLKGHVEPPFALRRYLPIVHLYLRDSNFDVDFAGGSALVARLLQAETGQKVNGIIGVDLSFVKELIASVGPINVPEYNENVTADNFFLLTETHAEKNFFPGSSQKKDFLRSFFAGLQNKLLRQKNISYAGLLDATATAVREKHLLFAFDDPGIQGIFTANDMSSSILDIEKQTGSDVADFVGINEANLGVNKVNYFLTRSMSVHAVINAEGIYSADVALTYKNTSQKDVWPGGDYKNYLRIILPLKAVLAGVSIDNQEQHLVPAVTDPLSYEKKGFVPPIGMEVEHYDENGRTVYGFLVNIPASEERKIKISYLLGEKFDLSKPLQRYTMFISKDPGTEADPFVYSVDYPESFRVINATAGLNNTGTTLSYVNFLRADQGFTVDLAKK